MALVRLSALSRGGGGGGGGMSCKDHATAWRESLAIKRTSTAWSGTVVGGRSSRHVSATAGKNLKPLTLKP